MNFDIRTFSETHKLTPKQVKSMRAYFADLMKWWKNEVRRHKRQKHPKPTQAYLGYLEGHVCAYEDILAMFGFGGKWRPRK